MQKEIILPIALPDVDLPKLLITLGACSSRKEAKRLIAQGAVELDGKVITDIIITLPGKDVVLRCGKTFFRKLMAMRKTFTVEVNANEGEAKIISIQDYALDTRCKQEENRHGYKT